MHLARSGARWMFQKRVPLDLVHLLGRNPIRLVLKVSGALDARRWATTRGTQNGRFDLS